VDIANPVDGQEFEVGSFLIITGQISSSVPLTEVIVWIKDVQVEVSREKTNVEEDLIAMTKKLLVVFLLLTLLVCPYIFVGLMFAPQAIRFLEPLVCPTGMEMEVVHSTGYDEEGESILQANIECTDDRDTVQTTWKMFLIMFGIPVIGIITYVASPSTTSKNADKIIMNLDETE